MVRNPADEIELTNECEWEETWQIYQNSPDGANLTVTMFEKECVFDNILIFIFN